MKGLKRERDEIDEKIDALAKQRRDQLIGDNATKVVIIKGDKRMIIPRSQLTQILKETDDVTIINNPKSLLESDLEDESHEIPCSKCGKQGIQIWRKQFCFDRYNNPYVRCISCLGSHTVLNWYEISDKMNSSWHPAILNNEGSLFESISHFMQSQSVKEKFLALPK
jgi:hypothetical protein